MNTSLGPLGIVTSLYSGNEDTAASGTTIIAETHDIGIIRNLPFGMYHLSFETPGSNGTAGMIFFESREILVGAVYVSVFQVYYSYGSTSNEALPTNGLYLHYSASPTTVLSIKNTSATTSIPCTWRLIKYS